MSIRILLFLLFTTLFSGCAVNKMDAHIFPDQNLGKINNFYVVKLDADERGVNELIRQLVSKHPPAVQKMHPLRLTRW